MEALNARVRSASVLELRMACDHVQTEAGALHLRAAELAGQRRPVVLRAIDRRIAELRGEDSPTLVRLVAEGRAVDADEQAWEAARQPQAHIAAAVGRGHLRVST